MSDNKTPSISERLAASRAGGNIGAPATLPQNPSNKDDPTTLAPESEKKVTEDQIPHVTPSGLTPQQQLNHLAKIETGMEGSVDKTAPVISKEVTPLDPMVYGATEHKEGSYPAGSYEALKMRQFFTADGTAVRADKNGMFVPETQEQKDLLKFYATKRFGLVKAI